MQIFEHISRIKPFLKELKSNKRSIGFVPTMGALHQGHLSLIHLSVLENDVTVCSIFVNPIQFNKKEDLIKYPRDYESDLEKLEKAGCNLVFMPSEHEMYPEAVTTIYEFGDLDKVMEGKFRPGHFNGVAIVVKMLFDIVEPDRAYFGLKDFQQLAIIKALVHNENIPVKIIPCSIIREKDGLAMSSRNQLLSPAERKTASFLYKLLQQAKEKISELNPMEIREWAIDLFEENNDFELEYFEIVDMNTLRTVSTWEESNQVIICLAAFLGSVRLIDNMVLFS